MRQIDWYWTTRTTESNQIKCIYQGFLWNWPMNNAFLLMNRIAVCMRRWAWCLQKWTHKSCLHRKFPRIARIFVTWQCCAATRYTPGQVHEQRSNSMARDVQCVCAWRQQATQNIWHYRIYVRDTAWQKFRSKITRIRFRSSCVPCICFVLHFVWLTCYLVTSHMCQRMRMPTGRLNGDQHRSCTECANISSLLHRI